LATGATVTCTFVAKVDTDASGRVVATVTDASGKKSDAAPAAFGFGGAAERRASNTNDCATAKTVRCTHERTLRPPALAP
jgi:hypothetical protein